MKNLRKDTRTSLAAAALSIVLLLIASAMVMKAIEAEFRSNVESHILNRRDSMIEVLELMNADAMARVRTIAAEPQLKKLAKALMRTPGDAALGARFADWITPIYQSRGFEGYSLISPGALSIVASGSPAYIGQPVSTQTAKEAIHRLEQSGAAIARPSPTARPVVTFGLQLPSGRPYQLVCARIDEERVVLGYLCLRDNPNSRLYRILEAGRPGATGESYIIDADARILSPIRFEAELAAPPGVQPGWSLFNVFARTPLTSDAPGKAQPAQTPAAPLTRVAAAISSTAVQRP